MKRLEIEDRTPIEKVLLRVYQERPAYCVVKGLLFESTPESTWEDIWRMGLRYRIVPTMDVYVLEIDGRGDRSILEERVQSAMASVVQSEGELSRAKRLLARYDELTREPTAF